VHSPLLLAITLAATSLGLIVPVLKDAGRADSDIGQTTIAASSVADFAAVVLLSLLFSTSGGSTGGRIVLLVLFTSLVVVIALVVVFTGRSMRLGGVLTRLQDTTAEIRVRAAVVLLVAFVVLAESFGLESILGACPRCCTCPPRDVAPRWPRDCCRRRPSRSSSPQRRSVSSSD
jgi:Kef-type K+ transport system membrane component KefB